MTDQPTDAQELENLRGPLTGYCYRMLGAAADTEDAVQETLLRALRSLDTFDPRRARLTTWVHRIATNVCLDHLRTAHRRLLIADTVPPPIAAGDIGPPLPAEQWIEPMPDQRLHLGGDPAARAIRQDSVRLAMLAAFQRLPPRQRAILILRDVLVFSAAETAAILDTTVPAVTSALQRARDTLERHYPPPSDPAGPDDPAQQALVRRYVAAFETHDVAELTAILREDARTTMPPFAWRLDGGALIARTMAQSPDCAADRLVPLTFNGAPGFGQYRPDTAGTLRPFALVSLELRGGLIAAIVTFLNCSDRFSEFGLPRRLS